MTNRITTKDLEYLLSQINQEKGYGPNPPYCTVGAIGLDWAYGGVKVVTYTSQSGGQRDLSCFGYGTKRQAYIFLRGMLAG